MVNNETNAPFVYMTKEDFNAIVEQMVMTRMEKEQTLSKFNQTEEAEEEFLSRFEVAEKLGVDLTTLWRWNKDGYLPNLKMGGKVVYPMSVIRKFIERNQGRFLK